MENFKVLSIKEEKNLDNKELKEYYQNLRNYVLNRELTNTTPGATTIAPKLKKVTNKIARKLTDVLAGQKVDYISDGQENIPDGPVIFAHTHQGLLDNFAWIPATPKHTIILHSAVVKKILVLCQLNTGLVLVEKENKANRFDAKLDVLSLLSRGFSLSYFPESAWNLSPNKLHLPLNYGFIDIAKKTGVPIIPVVDEYSYDTDSDKEKISKVHIRFGKPIYVSENDSLIEKLNEYEEAISTIRWDLIEEKGVFDRKSISNTDYINYLKGNIRNLKMGGIDIDVERRTIWNSSQERYVFNHINDIPFDENGNFLETEEVRKIKTINKRYRI